MEFVSRAEEVGLRKRIIRLEEHGFRVAKRGRRPAALGPLNPYSDITHMVVAPKATVPIVWRRIPIPPEACLVRAGLVGHRAGHDRARCRRKGTVRLGCKPTNRPPLGVDVVRWSRSCWRPVAILPEEVS